MKPLCMTLRSLVLMVAFVTVGACSQALPPESLEKNSSTTGDNVSQDAQADSVLAVVTAIDQHSGLVVLDSERGRLVTIATPAQLHDLHTGDLVLVHLSGDGENG